MRKMVDEREIEFKRVKQLTGGMRASSVWLLRPVLPSGKIDWCDERAVVEKTYDPRRKRSREQFRIETQILEHLDQQRCPFVPRLIKVDRSRWTIYESYCGGEKFSAESPEIRRKVVKLMQRLSTHYGVGRFKCDRQVWYPAFCNITQMGGKIFLIDFGARSWRILSR